MKRAILAEREVERLTKQLGRERADVIEACARIAESYRANSNVAGWIAIDIRKLYQTDEEGKSK